MCAPARPIRSSIRSIQPNYLSDPIDRRVLLAGMKLARGAAAHAGAGALFRPRPAAGRRGRDRRRTAGLRPPLRLHVVPSDRHRADGTGDRSDRGGGRPVAGARDAGAAGGRCLDHAEHAVGQHLCLDDDDRGEGRRHDPRPAAPGAGGGGGGVKAEPGSNGSGLALVTSLALAPDGQDEHRVDAGHEPVQRDIAARLPPDHQFPLTALHRPADERGMAQYLHRLHDLADPRERVLYLEPRQVLEEAIEIVQHFRRELDAGHAKR